MQRKIKIIIFFIVSFVLVGCKEKNALKIKKEDNNICSNIFLSEYKESKQNFGCATYSFEGLKNNTKINISLKKYSDGKIRTIFSSQSIDVNKNEKVVFMLDEKSFFAYKYDIDSISKYIHCEFESSLNRKDLNSWYWIDEGNITSKNDFVIFSSFSGDGSTLPTPDLNLINVEEWVGRHKEITGLFLELNISYN